MKRNLSVSFALAVVATLVVLIANPAYASTCTTATLSGSYGFISPGFVSAAPGTAINLSQDVAVASVGVFSFDGAGGFSSSYTLDVNGVFFPGHANSGTYTVGSDCTGSILVTAGNAAGTTFNLVVVAGGKEVFGMQIISGWIATFDAKKE